MRVEVVSDVVCPWCYIGKRRFERAIARLRDEGVRLDLLVRHRAYQLDPTAPLNAPQPVRDAYAKKFAGMQRADEILAHVTTVAAAEGLTFRMDRALRANTLRAHRLLKLVGIDAPEKQAAVNEAIMKAYFTDGLDISEVSTLIECARAADFVSPSFEEHLTTSDALNPVVQAVEEDLRWSAEREVTAVPTFVINDSFAVPGAQDTDTFVRLLRKIVTQ